MKSKPFRPIKVSGNYWLWDDGVLGWIVIWVNYQLKYDRFVDWFDTEQQAREFIGRLA